MSLVASLQRRSSVEGIALGSPSARDSHFCLTSKLHSPPPRNSFQAPAVVYSPPSSVTATKERRQRLPHISPQSSPHASSPVGVLPSIFTESSQSPHHSTPAPKSSPPSVAQARSTRPHQTALTPTSFDFDRHTPVVIPSPHKTESRSQVPAVTVPIIRTPVIPIIPVASIQSDASLSPADTPTLTPMASHMSFMPRISLITSAPSINPPPALVSSPASIPTPESSAIPETIVSEQTRPQTAPESAPILSPSSDTTSGFSPVPAFARNSVLQSRPSSVQSSRQSHELMFPACRPAKALSELSTFNTISSYLVPQSPAHSSVNADSVADPSDDDISSPWYTAPSIPATAPMSPLVLQQSRIALAQRRSSFEFRARTPRSPPAVNSPMNSPLNSPHFDGSSHNVSETPVANSDQVRQEVQLVESMVATLTMASSPPADLPSLIDTIQPQSKHSYSEAGRKLRIKYAERPKPPPENLSPRSHALKEELRMQHLAQQIGVNAPPPFLRNTPVEVTSFGHLLRGDPELRQRAEVRPSIDPVGTARFLRDIEDRTIALSAVKLRGSVIMRPASVQSSSPFSSSSHQTSSPISSPLGSPARALTQSAVSALHTFGKHVRGGEDAIDDKTKQFLLRRGQQRKANMDSTSEM